MRDAKTTMCKIWLALGMAQLGLLVGFGTSATDHLFSSGEPTETATVSASPGAPLIHFAAGTC